MTHQELKDLLPLYVVGGLDAESIAEVESHLDTDCDSCPDELREWREVAGFIPLGATSEGPSAGVKERLLQRVRQENGIAKVIPSAATAMAGLVDYVPVSCSGCNSLRDWRATVS